MAHRPTLSIVVLNWNALDLTRACVASLRATTDVDYELIVVDNGSEPSVADWVGEAADISILLPENQGFAPGMNAGLAAASGDFVMFVNNDTQFPPGWAGPLLETARRHPGITVPAVTDAGGRFGVRSEPGTEVTRVTPFRDLPSGVVYLVDRAIMDELGGWDERYRLASREDLDLLFTFWANGLSVSLDTRVLIEHVSSATVNTMGDRDRLWAENWRRFIEKWSDLDSEVPRLAATAPAEFAARRQEAATVAAWMDRWYQAEEGRKGAHRKLRERPTEAREKSATTESAEIPPFARLWSRVRNRLGAVSKRTFTPND